MSAFEIQVFAFSGYSPWPIAQLFWTNRELHLYVYLCTVGSFLFYPSQPYSVNHTQVEREWSFTFSGVLVVLAHVLCTRCQGEHCCMLCDACHAVRFRNPSPSKEQWSPSWTRKHDFTVKQTVRSGYSESSETTDGAQTELAKERNKYHVSTFFTSPVVTTMRSPLWLVLNILSEHHPRELFCSEIGSYCWPETLLTIHFQVCLSPCASTACTPTVHVCSSFNVQVPVCCSQTYLRQIVTTTDHRQNLQDTSPMWTMAEYTQESHFRHTNYECASEPVSSCLQRRTLNLRSKSRLHPQVRIWAVGRRWYALLSCRNWAQIKEYREDEEGKKRGGRMQIGAKDHRSGDNKQGEAIIIEALSWVSAARTEL